MSSARNACINSSRFKTEQEFREQITKDELTVGIFTTTWCPDCKRLGMFIEEVTEEHQDKQWFKIDRDEFPEISEEQR
ncbi:thioredoxin family protein [Peribacillus sp. R9-11]|uniref:thioredoxin family protein n=1 Tax=Peribacillus sp. R9-11 TaxID=3073271 RepID=UPI0028687C17|nr:thioredoxin family protein [Peribacillus sp. R9-11]WMX58782.1 thioredoxin family protein [Peribacillus sp. R9-11]